MPSYAHSQSWDDFSTREFNNPLPPRGPGRPKSERIVIEPKPAALDHSWWMVAPRENFTAAAVERFDAKLPDVVTQ